MFPHCDLIPATSRDRGRILHIIAYFIHPLVTGHLTLLFHIQPSPLKEKTAENETKLVYASFTITEVSCTVECWPTIHWLADGDGKGCYEKTGIYSVRLNGVSAMAAFDSPPGSGHSAVALETAQEPQKGMACLLALQSENVSRGNKRGSLWELICTVR